MAARVDIGGQPAAAVRVPPQVKHSEGFSVARNDDGSYTWTSRFGSTFTTPVPEYPVAVWPVEGTPEMDADVERLDLGSLMEEQFRSWMEETSQLETC